MYSYQQLPPDSTLFITSSIIQAKKSKESRIRLVHQKKTYSVPPKSFLELAKFDYLELDLSYCKQLDFQATFDLLANLPNLKVLSLIKCHSGIVPSNISKLKNLEKLILWNNDLTALPDEFSELKNLQELNLRTNKFKELPKQVLSLKKLEKLVICSNRIGQLPDEIFDLKNLQFLDVESCGLKEISSKIEQLTKLKRLKFGRNKIKEIPDVLLKMSALEKVEAVGNKEMDMPSFFRLLKKNGQDKKVNLSKNRLTELTKDLLILSDLENLDLSNNQLTELPDFLVEFKQLKTIDLRHNKFEKFPEILTKMPQLEHLYLSNNQLQSLSGAIENIESLVNLSIENNQIAALPDSMKNLKNLKNFTYWGNAGLTTEAVNKAWKGRLYHDGIKVDTTTKLENYEAEYGNIEKAIFWDVGVYDISEDLGKLVNLRELGFKNVRASYDQINYKFDKGEVPLPESVKNLKKIETISTYGCTKIEHFEWLLQNSKKLKVLHAGDLLLDDYLEYIYQCQDLEKLQIKLGTSMLSDEIIHLQQLKILSIRGTRLESLPAKIADLPNLKTLSIFVDSANWEAIMPVIQSMKSLTILSLNSKLDVVKDLSPIWNLPNLEQFSLSVLNEIDNDYEDILKSIAQISTQPTLYFSFKTDTIPAAITLFANYPKEKFLISLHQQKNWKPSLDLAIATKPIPSIKGIFGKNADLVNQVNAFIHQYKNEDLPELTKKVLFAVYLNRLDLIGNDLLNSRESVDLNEPQSVFISGRVRGLTKKKIEELLKENGHKLSKKIDKETTFAVLTSTTKSDLLIEIIDQKIPLWLEDDFKEWLWKMDTPYIMEKGAEDLTEQVKRLLFSEEETNFELALELVAGGGATPEITSYLLAIMLYHHDKDVRKKARKSFRIYASVDLQLFIKNNWKNSYRKSNVYSFMREQISSREDIDVVSFYLMIDSVLKRGKPANAYNNDRLIFQFPFVKMPDTLLLKKELKRLIFWNQNELDVPHLFNVLLKMPNLEELEISNNEINCVSEELLSMKKLKVLKLRGKQLQAFFNGKTKEELGSIFENLEHLQLIFEKKSTNVAGLLDGALFPKLKVLHLVNVPESSVINLELLTKLETLQMSGAGLKEIPDSILGLQKIKKINFEINQIEHLPKQLLCLPELSELYLKNNQIKDFPIDYFREKELFKQKLKLDISSNNIDTFPLSLFEFERQYGWEVKMVNNKITEMPNELPDIFKFDSNYNLGIYRLLIGMINGKPFEHAITWHNTYKKINFYG